MGASYGSSQPLIAHVCTAFSQLITVVNDVPAWFSQLELLLQQITA